jgi:hypothetical protein
VGAIDASAPEAASIFVCIKLKSPGRRLMSPFVFDPPARFAATAGRVLRAIGTRRSRSRGWRFMLHAATSAPARILPRLRGRLASARGAAAFWQWRRWCLTTAIHAPIGAQRLPRARSRQGAVRPRSCRHRRRLDDPSRSVVWRLAHSIRRPSSTAPWSSPKRSDSTPSTASPSFAIATEPRGR